jgi:hypothetical protein
MKPAPRTTHKPKATLIFMELSIFIPFCEHPQGQFRLLPAAKRFICLRANGCLRCLRAGEYSAFIESSSFEFKHWRMSKYHTRFFNRQERQAFEVPARRPDNVPPNN